MHHTAFQLQTANKKVLLHDARHRRPTLPCGELVKLIDGDEGQDLHERSVRAVTSSAYVVADWMVVAVWLV